MNKRLKEYLTSGILYIESDIKQEQVEMLSLDKYMKDKTYQSLVGV